MAAGSLVAFIRLSDGALDHDAVMERILGEPGALAGLRPGDGVDQLDPAFPLEEAWGACFGSGSRCQRLELTLSGDRLHRIDYWLQDLLGIEALFQRARQQLEARHGPPDDESPPCWRLQTGDLTLSLDQTDVFGSDMLHLTLAAPQR